MSQQCLRFLHPSFPGEALVTPSHVQEIRCRAWGLRASGSLVLGFAIVSIACVEVGSSRLPMCCFDWFYQVSKGLAYGLFIELAAYFAGCRRPSVETLVGFRITHSGPRQKNLPRNPIR